MRKNELFTLISIFFNNDSKIKKIIETCGTAYSLMKLSAQSC